MPELIYNQNDIPKDVLRYGLRTSAATGCGWIAVYNALCILGNPMEPKVLIRRFERMLPLIHGNAGTFAAAPAALLRHLGYRVTTSIMPKNFDTLAKKARVCILFYYWRSGWKVGAHFVALEYRQGHFVGYNTYRNSAGPDDYGQSLGAFLKEKGYFGCFLTAVESAYQRKNRGRM